MEEYLQYMKALRTQMNDVEDQAAKISVEEQMHLTTVESLEKDLLLVKNDTKRINEESECMIKAKGLICSQILERQRKIAALESDSYTLSQTLDLMQQEGASLSAKLVEKSSYYTNVAEDIATQLKDQQGWINAHKCSSIDTENGLVGYKSCHGTGEADDSQENTKDSLMLKLDAARAKYDQIIQMKSNLISENNKIKQSVELVKVRIDNVKPELQALDVKMLDEEVQALQADKEGEAEYLQSLELQIMTLKGISHTIRCSCGEEYRVEVGSGVEA